MKFRKVTLSSDLPDPPHIPADGTYPHCDQYVLHSAGVCQYCDLHPDWQADRVRLAMAFSDTSPEEIERFRLSPCPSTLRRPAAVRDRWWGNAPTPRVP